MPEGLNSSAAGLEPPKFSAGAYELLALAAATIGVVGVCNNLLVLVVYCKFRRLRTPTNLLLLNISLSDLLVSVFGVGLTFLSCLRGRWAWDWAGCVWDGFSNSLFGRWRPARPGDRLPNPSAPVLSAPEVPAWAVIDVRSDATMGLQNRSGVLLTTIFTRISRSTSYLAAVRFKNWCYFYLVVGTSGSC
ncbi:hypothetical protein NDU88_007948 [Pleurodeles waltl]|uniref:G-protein coupled receptors family 1 profile domain-containing protein n=1 Tax=Pleurodeles waltl TaxID=8319 RepID=A0AAV7RTC4_PLEWA|nr:hypothetical protein NDU88_007948 [Pleurodeles waltl]